MKTRCGGGAGAGSGGTGACKLRRCCPMLLWFLPARLSRLTICRRQLGLTMHKRMTITIDEAVYEGLYRTIGKRRMGQFIEDLVRPHVMGKELDEGYLAMAADKQREADALEWASSLARDMSDEAR